MNYQALHDKTSLASPWDSSQSMPAGLILSIFQMYECLQARQQSVEEVNQRWAAKSHTLLSRIANLEQQLQGQGQGQSGASPDAQVRHHSLITCTLV